MKQSRQAALLGVAALALIGGVTAVAVIGPSPSPSCLPDPAGQIAALPAGATFNGTGHCYTTEGITVTKSVVVDGGTYNDPDQLGNTAAPFNPIIKVKGASGVTIENVTLNGTNSGGGYHGNPYVGEEGIKLTASNHVTMKNVTTSATFGDGLELGFSPRQPPNVTISVEGYTVNLAGRQGVTIAFAYGVTMSGLDVASAADVGLDFESDVGVGSGTVSVANSTIHKGVWFQEPLQAPIAFTNDAVTGHVVDRAGAANSGTTANFTGGSLTIARHISGTPPGGIWVNGPGSLCFTNVPIGRPPGVEAVTGLPWVVVSGGHLALTHSPLTPSTPTGVNDSASMVTINP